MLWLHSAQAIAATMFHNVETKPTKSGSSFLSRLEFILLLLNVDTLHEHYMIHGNVGKSRRLNKHYVASVFHVSVAVVKALIIQPLVGCILPYKYL